MNNAPARRLTSLVCFCSAVCLQTLSARAQEESAKEQPLPELTKITVTSSIDGTEQPSRLYVPEIAEGASAPMLVFLHSWSGNYTQNNDAWLREAAERNWIFLHPDFRGRNDHPEACGSELARQDILDAVDEICRKYPVDQSRLYLAGASGGGHMTMLMAGYAPQRFSAASAWVGITDLAAWHRFHSPDGKAKGYAIMIEQSLGGPPGTSEEIDADYEARSPLFHIENSGDLPLDLAAGITDGHTGSVPVSHTLLAYNKVAEARGGEPISQSDIDQLTRHLKIEKPNPDDQFFDPEYDRDIILRRETGSARVTIFDGGHEGIAPAGCAWLARQQRPTHSVAD